jgi:hypothetical protein
MYTGYGLVLGAALGLLAGTLLSSELWIAPLLGAAVGLVIGAMVDARRGRDRSSWCHSQCAASRIRDALH